MRRPVAEASFEDELPLERWMEDDEGKDVVMRSAWMQGILTIVRGDEHNHPFEYRKQRRNVRLLLDGL